MKDILRRFSDKARRYIRIDVLLLVENSSLSFKKQDGAKGDRAKKDTARERIA